MCGKDQDYQYLKNETYVAQYIFKYSEIFVDINDECNRKECKLDEVHLCNFITLELTNLNIDLQRHISQVLLADLENMLCETTLRYYTKISFTYTLEIT